MTTRETIEGYFSALKTKNNWESFLSDDILFTSFHYAGKTDHWESGVP